MTDVTTHLRVGDADAVHAALAEAGLTAGDDGPLVAVLDADVDAADVSAVLGEWIAAARDAMERQVDVVTILSDDHLDGDDVGRVSVGHGLVAASRSYAFEGQRKEVAANVVVGDVTAPATLSTAAWVVDASTLSGQVLLTGSQLHGRQRP